MKAFAFLDHFNVDLPPEMAQLQISYSLCTGDLGLVRPKEHRTGRIDGRMEDVERSRAAGFDEHLTKPVDPERVLGMITRRAPRN